jgi:triosephosphate isomerase
MRKAMVAGNWKMNGSRNDATTLLQALKQGAAPFNNIEIAVFPSFVHIPLAQDTLGDATIVWGAQDLYPGASGAFTGEVSGPMLTDFGCQYVLIGHSERRHIFHESLDLVAEKFIAANDANLKPILCLGESLDERESNRTEVVLTKQLESVLKAASISAFKQTVIAYEPVWAIGTGLTASPAQAQEAHAFIRGLLAKQDVNLANSMRILYGGSVKADNATGLFAMPDIDGALVGGASLDVKSFLAICQASSSALIPGQNAGIKN